MRSHVWLLISGVSPKVWASRLDRDAMIVGRNATCDIQLTDAQVSRYHARIERSDGGWRVVDRGSTNGTYVNGERIDQAEIHVGDTLHMGRTDLIVANGTEDHPNAAFEVEEKTPSQETKSDCTIIDDENGVLTEKQKEVLCHLCRGLSRKKIATALDICESTVDSHIKSIYPAFGVHSQAELIALFEREHRRKSEPQ